MAQDHPQAPIRVRCTNPFGGPEGFKLLARGRGAVIDTPGAMTRTMWTDEQLRHLRDALNRLLGDGR